jgi:hypothetical protein
MAHRVAQRAEPDLDDIWLHVAKESSSRVAQTLAAQKVCGFPPPTTRGSGL